MSASRQDNPSSRCSRRRFGPIGLLPARSGFVDRVGQPPDLSILLNCESTAKINLALESGEVQGTVAAWTTLKTLSSQWLADKSIRLIAQWALRPNPELPGVPNILDLATNEADRDALLLVMARLDVGRPFFLPPNVPPERVAALRRAFDATLKDPAFLAEADKLKIDIDPLTGEQLADLIAQVSQTAPETAARVRAALEQR
jgi:hypothetical protein